jgi:hypothetical protein
VASVVSGALTPTYAADDGPKVTTNGSLGFALNMQDSNESWEMKNTKVRFGTNVVQMTDYGKIIGQIEFDYDNASNDSNQADGSGSTSSSDGDEIDVRNARVIWATPSIGKFVFAGRSPSGQYGTNYSRVDIFDGGGYHYFQQGDHTGKLIGYVSPAFSGVQAGVALFATNPANDEDQDLQHFRVEWNSGPWHVGYGQVENKTLTSDDTTREAFSFGYADGPLAVGVTSENKWGGNDGDDVLGVAGSYSVGDHTFRAAVYSQSSDTDANDGLSATTLEYSLALNKYTNVFVTMDQWDVTDTTDDDATVLGINMKW